MLYLRGGIKVVSFEFWNAEIANWQVRKSQRKIGFHRLSIPKYKFPERFPKAFQGQIGR